MGKLSTAAKLDAAKSDLAQAQRRIAEARTAYNLILLGNDDKGAIAAGQQLDGLQQQLRVFQDKVALWEAEAAKEADQKRAQNKATAVLAVEKMFDEHVAIGEKFSAAFAEADRHFCDLVRSGRRILESWQWLPHDAQAACIARNVISRSVSHEMYRLGARPRLEGGMDPPGVISMPAAQSPTIQLAGTPEKIPSLRDVLADAQRFACEFLRTGKSSSGHVVSADPVAGIPVHMLRPDQRPEPSADEREFSRLLAQMPQLANDISPAGEKAYHAHLARMAPIQARLDGIRLEVELQALQAETPQNLEKIKAVQARLDEIAAAKAEAA